MHVCVCVYACVRVCACVYACVCARVYVYVLVCMHVCVNAHTRLCMCKLNIPLDDSEHYVFHSAYRYPLCNKTINRNTVP